MTTKQTDDGTSPTAVQDGKTTHSVQTPRQGSSWQTNIPSLLSLACGSLGLFAFLISVRATKQEPLHGPPAVMAVRALFCVGTVAIVLGMVGLVLSRSLWFRVLALLGVCTGIVPAGVGLLGLLINAATS